MIMEKVLWKYEPVTVPQISKLVQTRPWLVLKLKSQPSFSGLILPATSAEKALLEI